MIQLKPTTIYCDNQGALALSKNDAKQHNRSKHTDVREQSTISYEYVPSCDNVADFLTKSVGGTHHKQLMKILKIEGTC